MSAFRRSCCTLEHHVLEVGEAALCRAPRYARTDVVGDNDEGRRQRGVWSGGVEHDAQAIFRAWPALDLERDRATSPASRPRARQVLRSGIEPTTAGDLTFTAARHRFTLPVPCTLIADLHGSLLAFAPGFFAPAGARER
jgi:hypothetical protein